MSCRVNYVNKTTGVTPHVYESVSFWDKEKEQVAQ